jgi:CRISPR/Cas system-associated exonuclease Cas4 (RecB family)
MISQTIIKEILKEDHCPLAVKNILEGIETEPSEAMLCGQYFEYHLIGGCRGDKVPEFKALKSGNKPKAELDLIKQIEEARPILEDNGVVITEVQPEVKFDDCVGHLDAVGTFKGTKVLFDLKWTATRYDDKWNGFADLDKRDDLKIQAAHYQWLYYQANGEELDFYFLVFGKSGWVRFIKIPFQKDLMDAHEYLIHETRFKLRDMANKRYKATPTQAKCHSCRYKDTCNKKTNKVEVEEFTIMTTLNV